MTSPVDVLIPTYNRAAALAVTLTSLGYQTCGDFRVVISDQSDEDQAARNDLVRAAVQFLELKGRPVTILHHTPRRGLAEQRQFLLEQARGRYALFLDDDLILEPYVIDLMLRTMQAEQCGFVGSAVIGLSYLEDERPHEQACELWSGPVQPERVRPGSVAWERYKLHNAANLYHVQARLGATPEQPLRYKLAWSGGCVLYATAKLRKAGGFKFWNELPTNHCGEDVLVQLRMMERYGGCGIMPSGVYHQELPTTVPDRQVNAPEVFLGRTPQPPG